MEIGSPTGAPIVTQLLSSPNTYSQQQAGSGDLHHPHHSHHSHHHSHHDDTSSTDDFNVDSVIGSVFDNTDLGDEEIDERSRRGSTVALSPTRRRSESLSLPSAFEQLQLEQQQQQQQQHGDPQNRNGGHDMTSSSSFFPSSNAAAEHTGSHVWSSSMASDIFSLPTSPIRHLLEDNGPASARSMPPQVHYSQQDPFSPRSTTSASAFGIRSLETEISAIPDGIWQATENDGISPRRSPVSARSSASPRKIAMSPYVAISPSMHQRKGVPQISGGAFSSSNTPRRMSSSSRTGRPTYGNTYFSPSSARSHVDTPSNAHHQQQQQHAAEYSNGLARQGSLSSIGSRGGVYSPPNSARAFSPLASPRSPILSDVPISSSILSPRIVQSTSSESLELSETHPDPLASPNEMRGNGNPNHPNPNTPNNNPNHSPNNNGGGGSGNGGNGSNNGRSRSPIKSMTPRSAVGTRSQPPGMHGAGSNTTNMPQYNAFSNRLDSLSPRVSLYGNSSAPSPGGSSSSRVPPLQQKAILMASMMEGSESLSGRPPLPPHPNSSRRQKGGLSSRESTPSNTTKKTPVPPFDMSRVVNGDVQLTHYQDDPLSARNPLLSARSAGAETTASESQAAELCHNIFYELELTSLYEMELLLIRPHPSLSDGGSPLLESPRSSRLYHIPNSTEVVGTRSLFDEEGCIVCAQRHSSELEEQGGLVALFHCIQLNCTHVCHASCLMGLTREQLPSLSLGSNHTLSQFRSSPSVEIDTSGDSFASRRGCRFHVGITHLASSVPVSNVFEEVTFVVECLTSASKNTDYLSVNSQTDGASSHSSLSKLSFSHKRGRLTFSCSCSSTNEVWYYDIIFDLRDKNPFSSRRKSVVSRYRDLSFSDPSQGTSLNITISDDPHTGGFCVEAVRFDVPLLSNIGGGNGSVPPLASVSSIASTPSPSLSSSQPHFVPQGGYSAPSNQPLSNQPYIYEQPQPLYGVNGTTFIPQRGGSAPQYVSSQQQHNGPHNGQFIPVSGHYAPPSHSMDMYDEYGRPLHMRSHHSGSTGVNGGQGFESSPYSSSTGARSGDMGEVAPHMYYEMGPGQHQDVHAGGNYPSSSPSASSSNVNRSGMERERDQRSSPRGGDENDSRRVRHPSISSSHSSSHNASPTTANASPRSGTGKSPLTINTNLTSRSRTVSVSSPTNGELLQAPEEVVVPLSPRALEAKAAEIRRQKESGEIADDGSDPIIPHVVNRVVTLAKSQAGSRFLQQRIKEGDMTYFDIVFEEAHDHFGNLMVDLFGNYLCQTLIENCSADQRTSLISMLQPDLAGISCDRQGTRAVQKLVTCSTNPEQVELMVGAFDDGRIFSTCVDSNGSHVIHAILDNYPIDSVKCVFEVCHIRCREMALDQHGLCVLKKCVTLAPRPEFDSLSTRILEYALDLVNNQYGNYLIQHLINRDDPECNVRIQNALKSHYAQLSRQKFSSNVVEKCLKAGSQVWKSQIVRELGDESAVSALLQDSYGNYVMQNALGVATPDEATHLITVIRPRVGGLRKNVRRKWERLLKECTTTGRISPSSISKGSERKRERGENNSSGGPPHLSSSSSSSSSSSHHMKNNSNNNNNNGGMKPRRGPMRGNRGGQPHHNGSGGGSNRKYSNGGGRSRQPQSSPSSSSPPSSSTSSSHHHNHHHHHTNNNNNNNNNNGGGGRYRRGGGGGGQQQMHNGMPPHQGMYMPPPQGIPQGPPMYMNGPPPQFIPHQYGYDNQHHNGHGHQRYEQR